VAKTRTTRITALLRRRAKHQKRRKEQRGRKNRNHIQTDEQAPQKPE
jgi:hypothetical protein